MTYPTSCGCLARDPAKDTVSDRAMLKDSENIIWECKLTDWLLMRGRKWYRKQWESWLYRWIKFRVRHNLGLNDIYVHCNHCPTSNRTHNGHNSYQIPQASTFSKTSNNYSSWNSHPVNYRNLPWSLNSATSAMIIAYCVKGKIGVYPFVYCEELDV